MEQSAVDYLIKQVKSKEWQDLYIWHKEEVFQKAKQIEQSMSTKTKQQHEKL